MSLNRYVQRRYPINKHWPDYIDHIRDTIERKHPKWGFVIQRCTYDNDDAWTQLVNATRRDVPEGLADRDALDLLESFKLDIREDSQTLDGASPDKVREIFRTWVLSHGMAECPDSQLNRMFNDGTPDEVVVPVSTRYH